MKNGIALKESEGQPRGKNQQTFQRHWVKISIFYEKVSGVCNLLYEKSENQHMKSNKGKEEGEHMKRDMQGRHENDELVNKT